MEQKLLADWDNRPSTFFVPDERERISREMALLEALNKIGCPKTRDGLSIKVQLDERQALLLEISKTPRKIPGVLGAAPDAQNLPPATKAIAIRGQKGG